MIEFFYSLFLLSGLIKFFIILYASRIQFVDFTLLTAFIVAGIYLFHSFKNAFLKNHLYIIHRSKGIILCMVSLYLWMITTLIYSPSPGYSYIKTLMFLTGLLALLIPLIHERFNPEKFFQWFIYIGTLLIFIYSALLPGVYADYLRYYDSREFVVKYLDVGYLSGLFVLILAFIDVKIKPIVRIALIGINAWAIMISSARGPLVFLVFVLLIKFSVAFVSFLKKREFNFRSILYGITGAVVLGAGGIYFIDKYAILFERSINRLLLLLDPQSSSVAKRFSLIDFSLEKIFDNAGSFLFGRGVGSFGFLYDGIDERNYPHNVILEIGFELGFIGVLLFLCLIFLYFKKIRINLNLTLIFLYLILNSLKSYSLVDSRIMFGILSVLVLYRVLLTSKREMTNEK